MKLISDFANRNHANFLHDSFHGKGFRSAQNFFTRLRRANSVLKKYANFWRIEFHTRFLTLHESLPLPPAQTCQKIKKIDSPSNFQNFDFFVA